MEFTAYAVDDEGNISDTPAATATSSENGIIIFTKLAKGKYAIKETKSVDPYKLCDDVFYANVDDNDFAGLTDKDGNKITGNRIIDDQYRTDISFTKVSENNQAKKLAGSTYGLYKKNASNALTQIAQATTDDEGVLEFEVVFIGVEYTVQEITAPEGFYVSENPITISFAVNEDGEPVIDKIDDGSGTIIRNANGEITWLEPEISVSFLKQDLVGNNLEGAKLKVVDSDGNEVISWTSTKEAYLVDGVFSAGETYSLVEVEAPEGYDIATPVSFTIDEKAGSEGKDTITVIMQDAPKSRTEVKAPVKSNPEAPKTRDNAPIRPVTTMMMSSLAGIMYLILIGKRQRRRRIKR